MQEDKSMNHFISGKNVDGFQVTKKKQSDRRKLKLLIVLYPQVIQARILSYII